MELVCANCTYTAPRLVKGECDACWKYRKRHNGQKRPIKHAARTADSRGNRVQLDTERAMWRANGDLLRPVDDLHDEYVDYPDGTNRETVR